MPSKSSHVLAEAALLGATLSLDVSRAIDNRKDDVQEPTLGVGYCGDVG